jgi:restriction endonuclease Mrr
MFVQRCRRRHQAIDRFDAAARKHKFAGQKAMTLVPAAQQNLRHFAGAIEQNQRCGIARFEIRKRLIAHAAREPRGAIRCCSAGADAQIVIHQKILFA